MSELSSDFRTAFRHHPAGVALITATIDQAYYGLTISSLASLSIDPVAVSFSLAKESGAAGAVLAAQSFVIHLLGEDQQELAGNFAQPGAPRFTRDQNFRILPTGEPHFIEAPVAFRASIHSSISIGGSRLIAAEVHEVLHGQRLQQHLVYQDREYLKLSELRAASASN
ncbi:MULTISPECIES: flavin reductase family protein [Glutamicibacter]|uniref:Flavin reductase n=1 Tax=Glutamicibacter nicotianae TaxID=37929 RepID=A0ABQ0RLJ7_GLUNI|nr:MULTISPECIES: flavin reductase family protein [Glutamicibacter]MDV2976216.1 flavin reductase family protein [Actinomycetes bacterium ARC8]MBM7768685.1 flavin reductase (DIM6/NTAB) family NADH-FMN oxidoreductase RutF [Glutamicibacter nicotianae]UTM47090.1 flavin reductase family protein [Glutamicibacter mysorens]WIV42546.1 flavin reductase family protein [Glutamicibacter nicotianae]GEC12691.1 flavin reductase [Glutamicibacter nicotianae]